MFNQAPSVHCTVFYDVSRKKIAGDLKYAAGARAVVRNPVSLQSGDDRVESLNLTVLLLRYIFARPITFLAYFFTCRRMLDHPIFVSGQLLMFGGE